MKSLQALPNGFNEIYRVDLKNQKRTALLVNIAALIIAAIMVIPAAFLVPISSLFDMSQGVGIYFLRFGVIAIGLLAYIILHEAVHGITMKLFGTKKVKYGFAGLYAFAGSSDFYDKRSYITIALAPVVIWGIILSIITVLVPQSWFWVVYFIQITNISGAAGDFYVTAKFLKMPKDILVSDSGFAMVVYSKYIESI